MTSPSQDQDLRTALEGDWAAQIAHSLVGKPRDDIAEALRKAEANGHIMGHAAASPAQAPDKAGEREGVERFLLEMAPDVQRSGDFVGLTFSLSNEAEQFTHLLSRLSELTSQPDETGGSREMSKVPVPTWLLNFIRDGARTVLRTSLPGGEDRDVAERAAKWADEQECSCVVCVAARARQPNGTEASRGVGAEVWYANDKLPDVGRKFIALWDDGSGAALLYRHDDGFIDSDGDDSTVLSTSLDRWAYLPDDFEFRCELVAEPGEAPMSLTVAATPTPPLSPDSTGPAASNFRVHSAREDLRPALTPSAPIATPTPPLSLDSTGPAGAPRVLSAKLIPWEPSSAGGVALVFSDGLECAMPLEGEARPPRDLSTEQVSELLRKACDHAGGQSAFADKHDLSKQYVNNVCNGQREPGQGIAEALGLQRRVVFSPLSPHSPGPAGAGQSAQQLAEEIASKAWGSVEYGARLTSLRHAVVTEIVAALTPSAPIAAPVRDDGQLMMSAPKDREILLYGVLGRDRSMRPAWYIGKWSDACGFWAAHALQLHATSWAELPSAPAGDVPGEAQTQDVRR
jgi:hypothetical protein